MLLIRARRRSSGFTLISTLVGLTVGLLSIAAMLTLYRNVIDSAKSVKEQARRDGQVATGSLISQQEMQQAGFGITHATIGTDLVVLSNAALSAEGKLKGTDVGAYSSMVTGNAVVWGFNPTASSGTTDPAGYQCEGLLVTSTGLQWLTPTSCKNAANWQGVSWKTHQLASTGNLGPLSIFQATPGSCFPYQQTAPGSSFQVSYYLPTYAQEHAGQSNGSDSSSSSGDSGYSGKDNHGNGGNGNHYGWSNSSGSGSSSGSSDSAASSGTSSSSDSSSLPSSSSSVLSTSSAVINIPAFSVCLPNFKPQGTS